MSHRREVKQLIEKMIRWFRQRRCCHEYRKHWNRTSGQHGGYVRRCVKCGKIE
nr:MAG TPA: Halobacterial output domain 2 [Caudoviricetes sp.]